MLLVVLWKKQAMKRRVQRLSVDANERPSEQGLRGWVKEVELRIGPHTDTKERQLKVLRLLWTYRHLNGGALDKLMPIDLTVHRSNFIEPLPKHCVATQRIWPPVQEQWMKKLVRQGLEGGVLESTILANGRSMH